MTAAHGSSPDRGLICLDEPLVETLAWQPAARPEAWITALAYTENTENIPIITKHYQRLPNTPKQKRQLEEEKMNVLHFGCILQRWFPFLAAETW